MTLFTRLDSRFAEECRKEGLVVHELGRNGEPGRDWLTPIRDYKAGQVYGQANHWDAISTSIDPVRWSKMLQRFARFGYKATYSGGMHHGEAYLWARGRTVNVGKVAPSRVALVKAGQPMPDTRPSRHNQTFGNSHFLGWVINHPGPKVPIPQDQIDGLHILNAVACDLYGFSPVQSVQHSDLTSRKIDIRGLDLVPGVTRILDKRRKARVPRPAPIKVQAPPAQPVRKAATTTVAEEDWPVIVGVLKMKQQEIDQAYLDYVGQLPDRAGRHYWLGLMDAALAESDAEGKKILASLKWALQQRSG